MISTAFVKIWGKIVGAIAWNESNQLGHFEYDPNFISSDWELAPMKMPLSKSQRIFSFPDLRPEKINQFHTFKGLPGLLADTLPDKYGSQLINTWLAQNGRAHDSMNPVETLCFIGKRGIGALEFEPAMFETVDELFNVEVDGLVEITRQIMTQRKDFSTNLIGDDLKAMHDILKIGTSAGGARPKAVIAYNKKTGEVKSGQGAIPNNFEHWLIKLDGVSKEQFGGSLGYGRIEMAYYLMAKSAGIEMMVSQLLEENGRAHFMTKRFDRKGNNIKHHVQTFCALQHFDFNNVSSYSYEQLFQTIRQLNLPYVQAEQLYKRMVFNVVARNCDDHTKNFSFLLKQHNTWELSPAYDICHAYRPDSIWVSQHALSINGKRKNINQVDLLKVAKTMNIKKAKSAIDQVISAVNSWKNFASEAQVSKKYIDSIERSFVKLE